MYIVNLTEAIVTNKNAKGGTDTVFDNSRYLTCGVDSTIPLELQLFLWECVERMPAPKDYLQVFELSAAGPMQAITHSSEDVLKTVGVIATILFAGGAIDGIGCDDDKEDNRYVRTIRMARL